jgi:hypothetical protein
MPNAPRERRYPSIPFWRRARRILLLAAIACLIPTGVSYVSAMTEKHNVGLGVSSVEWLRQNGGNALVSETENWYYTLNAPEEGGSTAALAAPGRYRKRRHDVTQEGL